MEPDTRPLRFVVPIFGLDGSRSIQQFLGTGTFVSDPPRLVTAEHVIRDWNGPLGIAVLPDIRTIYPAELLRSDREADLAVLVTPNYVPEKTVQVARGDDFSSNSQIVSLEYGTTRVEGRNIRLAPATRLGNVTRQIDLSSSFGKAGIDILELSFPALRGASGSPVLSNPGQELWGVVVANACYHMLPLQIESILDKSGSVTEETRFLLPQGLAVHVKHLRPLLPD